MRPGFLKRRFGKIVILLILIIILSCSVFFIAKNIFTIRYIEVEGTDVLVSIDEKRLSKNLLFFPVEKFRSEIVKSNPVLQDVRFEKKYPHTLKIIPVVRTPFVRLSSGGRLVLLDKEGVVLQDGDRELSIPLLTLTVPLFHVGETLKDESVQFLLAFVLNMNTLLLISSITQTDSAYYSR
jgi:cell division septal protein FtsQ